MRGETFLAEAKRRHCIVVDDEWISVKDRLPNEKEREKSYCTEEHGSSFIVMVKGSRIPTQLYLTKNNCWVDEIFRVYDVVAWRNLPNAYIEDITKSHDGWTNVLDCMPNDQERKRNKNAFIVMIKGAIVPTELSITQDDRWLDLEMGNFNVVAWRNYPESYIKRHEPKLKGTGIC